jgi:rhamnosyl/mannosyltransferase
MRVLHVFKTFFPDPPGGVQEAIRQICRSTATHGVDNTVFCLSPDPTPSQILVPERVRRCRSWAAPASCDLGGLDAIRQFRHLARQHDIIHYHFPWPFADVMHFAAQVRAKTVMTYHSDIVKQKRSAAFYYPLMWKMLKQMDAIVATSPAYAASSSILSDQSIRSRVSVIPLAEQDVYPDFKRAFPIVLDTYRKRRGYILFLGALRYYKGLSTLIDAAKMIAARIIIAGDGPLGPELRQKAHDQRCPNVEFLGPVSDTEKYRLIEGCGALVLPSEHRSEAFGMVLVEAAMFGKPMVTTELRTGTSYVNLHNETGFVVPPGDPAALAQALNAILRNEVLAHRMARKARARYLELFSAAQLGKNYLTLYRKMLGQEPLPEHQNELEAVLS